ncbi:MAG: precorrin-6A/cobalt-precorrin-6A reductase, partial [Ruminiclostridium sp.]|nr:precorrin-6A/cobalt-precorrin-6A reductase [Ruminiclostridium sp.]
ILSTLGSKEIPLLTAVNDRKRRVWIRALPAPGLAGQCEGCGFDPSHIITGKPPFSEEENIGHIKQSCAEILVTKECGTAGGYPEKIAAAAKCGIETITVTRPRESGHTFAELTEIIRKSL